MTSCIIRRCAASSKRRWFSLILLPREIVHNFVSVRLFNSHSVPWTCLSLSCRKSTSPFCQSVAVFSVSGKWATTTAKSQAMQRLPLLNDVVFLYIKPKSQRLLIVQMPVCHTTDRPFSSGIYLHCLFILFSSLRPTARPSCPGVPVVIPRQGGDAFQQLAYSNKPDDAVILQWAAPYTDGGTPVNGRLDTCHVLQPLTISDYISNVARLISSLSF